MGNTDTGVRISGDRETRCDVISMPRRPYASSTGRENSSTRGPSSDLRGQRHLGLPWGKGQSRRSTGHEVDQTSDREWQLSHHSRPATLHGVAPSPRAPPPVCRGRRHPPKCFMCHRALSPRLSPVAIVRRRIRACGTSARSPARGIGHRIAGRVAGTYPLVPGSWRATHPWCSMPGVCHGQRPSEAIVSFGLLIRSRHCHERGLGLVVMGNCPPSPQSVPRHRSARLPWLNRLVLATRKLRLANFHAIASLDPTVFGTSVRCGRVHKKWQVSRSQAPEKAFTCIRLIGKYATGLVVLVSQMASLDVVTALPLLHYRVSNSSPPEQPLGKVCRVWPPIRGGVSSQKRHIGRCPKPIASKVDGL